MRLTEGRMWQVFMQLMTAAFMLHQGSFILDKVWKKGRHFDNFPVIFPNVKRSTCDRQTRCTHFPNNLFQLNYPRNVSNKLIVHHHEVCTSSLQYCTVLLYGEFKRWYCNIDSVPVTRLLIRCKVNTVSYWHRTPGDEQLFIRNMLGINFDVYLPCISE